MKSKYTLFLSWQSDVNSARSAIESAVKGAISSLLDTDQLNIELDESTWNVPGMPKIEDVIKDKIENSDIFVADITPIATKDTKQLPNPNVLIELGYALKCLGPERIILVAQNKAGWDVKDLPFDINHHRIQTFKTPSQCDLRRSIREITKLKKKVKYSWPHFDIKLSSPSFGFIKSLFGRDKKDQLPVNPTIFEDSEVFFSQRIAYAFPGERGVKWYTKASDIKLHLEKLLHTPLLFSTGNEGGRFCPIWWFGRGSSVEIRSFKHLGGRRFLIGWEEWNISKIAVFQDSGVYYREYVYVEIDPQKPTNLGQISDRTIELGDTEEYGILKVNPLLHIKMTRHEYDDGGCKRYGILFHGRRELRERYLSRFNFLICAHGSSYNALENSHKFDSGSRYYMDGILNGTVSYDEFHEFLMSFPKPHYRR